MCHGEIIKVNKASCCHSHLNVLEGTFVGTLRESNMAHWEILIEWRRFLPCKISELSG